jgi:hypothetical protein
VNRPKTHREIQSAVETVGVRNLRDRSGPLNFTVRGRIVVLSKPVRVVGAVAAIAAVPLTALAGLAVSNQAPVYLLFVVTATAFVGTAAMLLFPLMLMVTGTSRAGFCVAGVLCALATCLVFVFLFTLLGALMGRGPWLAGFIVYAAFSFIRLGPALIAVGPSWRLDCQCPTIRPLTIVGAGRETWARVRRGRPAAQLHR